MGNVLDFERLKRAKLDDAAKENIQALLDLYTQHAQALVHADLLAGMIEDVRAELQEYLERTGQAEGGE